MSSDASQMTTPTPTVDDSSSVSGRSMAATPVTWAMLSEPHPPRGHSPGHHADLPGGGTVLAMALAHVPGESSTLPPLTWSSAFTEATFDLLPAMVIVALAAAYVIGVRALAARGRHWSTVLTACFLT